MSRFSQLKEASFRANMELFDQGLAKYTFGNASEGDQEGRVFAIKPSGVPYQELAPEKMVIVGFDGRVVEGDLNPSSDTATHCVLYRHFPGIGGVAHTHSPYAVAWAQAMKPIPILGTTHADFLPGSVPCTGVMPPEKIRQNYEEETGVAIVSTFQKLDYREIPMVLVACHGPFSWGASAAEAVYHSVMLEELARMALMTLALNPDTPSLPKALIRKHFERKHGTGATYGQRKKS